jgi:ribosomal RNA-processing protein 9
MPRLCSRPDPAIEQPGVVNGVAFTKSGRFMVVATGQEHRLGRWWRCKEGKNGLAVVRLPLDTSAAVGPSSSGL